jgi:hypothetical protein
MKITVLAVSKLGNELCIAGVDDDRNWIRPTCLSRGGWRQFYKADIYDENNNPVISLSNVVDIHLIRPIPQIGTPHIEDWEYDRRFKPILIRTLNDSQRLQLFQEISSRTLDPLINNYRSLCLIEPSFIVSANFANISVRGRYQPILDFRFEGRLYSYKVTDIYWRAIGRHLPRRILDGRELQNILRYSKIFLTIGLTRLYRNRYWPMVVGVHTVPYFPIMIDYENI